MVRSSRSTSIEVARAENAPLVASGVANDRAAALAQTVGAASTGAISAATNQATPKTLFTAVDDRAWAGWIEVTAVLCLAPAPGLPRGPLDILTAWRVPPSTKLILPARGSPALAPFSSALETLKFEEDAPRAARFNRPRMARGPA